MDDEECSAVGKCVDCGCPLLDPSQWSEGWLDDHSVDGPTRTLYMAIDMSASSTWKWSADLHQLCLRQSRHAEYGYLILHDFIDSGRTADSRTTF